ncbi:MAG: hypothetical protein R3F20_09855 [Planctomycetota bacterium]
MLTSLVFGEFGPAQWTRDNWMGVGLWAVAFLLLLALGWRCARPPAPADDDDRVGEER